jgi:hypothetical protein
MGYNSGARARELGIGSSGSLPSNPDLDYVFHGKITPQILEKVLGRKPTSEDIETAIQLASRPENKNLDIFVKELLGVGGDYALKTRCTVSSNRLCRWARARPYLICIQYK